MKYYIYKDELEQSREIVEARLATLNDAVPGKTDDERDAIAILQSKGLKMLARLNREEIEMMTDSTKVTARQINDAAVYVDDVVKDIQEFARFLKATGLLITFMAVVATGNVPAIIAAALALKKGMDALQVEEEDAQE